MSTLESQGDILPSMLIITAEDGAVIPRTGVASLAGLAAVLGLKVSLLSSLGEANAADFTQAAEGLRNPEVRPLCLMNDEKIKEVAEINGYKRALVTRGLSRFRQRGLCFPDSKESVRQSYMYHSVAPLYYFPHQLLTADLVRLGRTRGLSLTEGFQARGYYPRQVFSPVDEVIDRLRESAELDIGSLRKFVYGTTIRDMSKIAESTIVAFQALSDDLMTYFPEQFPRSELE